MRLAAQTVRGGATGDLPILRALGKFHPGKLDGLLAKTLASASNWTGHAQCHR
jgi:hypothetical protein